MSQPNKGPESLRTLFEYIESDRSHLIQFAKALIASDTRNPPGTTTDIIEYIEDLGETWGIHTERIVEDARKPNVLLTLPGKHDRSLLFNGHVDTVPFDTSEWDFDPLGERVGSRLYGRGSTDMKGAIAGMLQSVQAFVGTETTPPVTLQYAFVSDEETAGHAGLQALLDRESLAAEACIVGEPTCEQGQHSVTVADKGSIWLTLEANGIAAHGSRPPFGQNAIELLIDAVSDLREWVARTDLDIEESALPVIDESISYYSPRLGEREARALFWKPTLNIGTFNGGETINRIPDAATAELDFRLSPSIHTPSILTDIESILAEHPSVEIVDKSLSIGTFEPIQSPLVEATATSAEAVVGERVYRRSATGGGDAKRLRNAGIHTVEFAFATETAHAVNEYTTIPALENNAKVYSLVPFRWDELHSQHIAAGDKR